MNSDSWSFPIQKNYKRCQQEGSLKKQIQKGLPEIRVNVGMHL